MIAMLLFSALAALLVFMAGRVDEARDPRFTTLALGLLAVFPVLLAVVPKTNVLPPGTAGVRLDSFPWMSGLLMLWVLGFCVMALRLGMAVRELAGWRKRSHPVAVSGGVEIRQLPGLRGPMAAGVFRPVIYVPDSWGSWSDETREMVLAHEMTHHRRRDPLWRWVAEIACMVNGGNPLVIWMARRLTVQCEFACDANLLGKGVAVRDYARLLCDFAEDRDSRGPVLAMAERSTLESRVRRLMCPGRNLSVIGFLLLAIPTLVFAGALASIGRQATPDAPVPQTEADLRWSANPFPGEN